VKHVDDCRTEIDAVLGDANRVLIATDFDGTLCPIAEHRDEVRLSGETLDVLDSLAKSTKVEVAVISGRSLSDLQHLVPLKLIMAGNHGLEISSPENVFRHPTAVSLRPAIERACEVLRRAVAHWPGAWVEDKGLTATLHVRNVEMLDGEAVSFAARRWLAQFGREITLHEGIESVEIRPRVGWDKGCALDDIAERHGPFDACLCIGDDTTDEAMFRSAHANISVVVGPSKNTAAQYCLSGQEDVRPLLSDIAELLGAEASTA